MNHKIAEVALKYRSSKPVAEMPMITSPQQAVQVLRDIWEQDTIQLKEEFVVLLLNNSKRCLGWNKVSSGGSTATIVEPAAIFQIALLGNAHSIILVHNHPSGKLMESKADIQLTKRIVKSGRMLGITVNDHIILTAEGYLSFKAKGLIK